MCLSRSPEALGWLRGQSSADYASRPWHAVTVITLAPVHAVPVQRLAIFATAVHQESQEKVSIRQLHPPLLTLLPIHPLLSLS